MNQSPQTSSPSGVQFGFLESGYSQKSCDRCFVQVKRGELTAIKVIPIVITICHWCSLVGLLFVQSNSKLPTHSMNVLQQRQILLLFYHIMWMEMKMRHAIAYAFALAIAIIIIGACYKKKHEFNIKSTIPSS